MTNEEHKLLIQKIVGSINNQAELTSLLSDLSKDYAEVLEEQEKFRTTNENLIVDNENLRSTNMKLFLQVGGSQEKVKEEFEKPPEEPKEDLTNFEDLFSEKGELKNV